MRSRFILSGLLTCSLSGNRYQGVTRHKSKKRSDGTRVTTRYYGCGGHVTKGNNVCTMNAIPQADLEASVIEAVFDFYKPYLAKNGRRTIAEEVKRQLGSEREDFVEARGRAEAEQQSVTQTINNLLDNITPTNRDFVDRRLKELTEQRRQVEARLEELDRLTATQAEIRAIVDDTLRFLSSLEFTLRQGLPQEKLVALRQCVQRIHVDRPASEIKLTLHTIPSGNFQKGQVILVKLKREGAVSAV